MMQFEIDKIKARIAKAERRIKAGYVPKESNPTPGRVLESEQNRVVRLTALLNKEGK
jgi:hypothetical protein